MFIVPTKFHEITLEIKWGCLGACSLTAMDFQITLILWGNKMDSRNLFSFLEGRPCKGWIEAVALYGTLALLASACPPPYCLDPSLVAAHLTCQSLSFSVLEWTSKCVEYRVDVEVCEKQAAFHIPEMAPKTFLELGRLE